MTENRTLRAACQRYKDWVLTSVLNVRRRHHRTSGHVVQWHCEVDWWTLIWRWTSMSFNAAKMITHSVVSSWLDYANTLLLPTSTSCKWHRTHWPGWCVKHQVTCRMRTTGTTDYLSHLIADYQPEWTLNNIKDNKPCTEGTARHCNGHDTSERRYSWL